MKSRIMRWAGDVALMGVREMNTGLWWEDTKKGDHLKNLGLIGG